MASATRRGHVNLQQEINNYREVVFEPEFDAQLAAMSSDFEAREDFINGTVWVLARNPEEGHRLSPDSKVWFVTLPKVDGFPASSIYYTFSSEKVWLMGIQPVSNQNRIRI